MNMQTLALAFLAATAIGGLAWVFIYPLLSGEKKAETRRAVDRTSPNRPRARQADKSQRSRREQVEGSLKELEARAARRKSRSRSAPASTQAGLDWTTAEILDHFRHSRRGRLCRSRMSSAAASARRASAWLSPPASACRAGCWLSSRSAARRHS